MPVLEKPIHLSFIPMENKKALVHTAMQMVKPRTVTDFGGCWGIHGAYLWEAVDNYPVEEALLIDNFLTPQTREEAAKRSNVSIVQRDFSGLAHETDLALLFDILLHQVNPGWKEVVKLRTQNSRAIAIYNPQWNGEETIRLAEMSVREFFKVLPCSVKNAVYQKILRDDAFGEARDSLALWQWGIIDAYLVNCFERNGFELVHKQDDGPWRESPYFNWKGFLFIKQAHV